MKKAQQARLDSLYQRHVNALSRQGKADNTVDAYARALRRITEFFDCVPDRLTREDLKDYFSSKRTLAASSKWVETSFSFSISTRAQQTLGMGRHRQTASNESVTRPSRSKGS